MTEKALIRVYDAIRRGAATSAEVIAVTGLKAATVRARLSELSRDGVVRAVGVRHSAKGMRGAHLYEVADG